MNLEASWRGFVAAIVFGMGVHVGWGLITLVIWLLAKAVGNADLSIGP